MNTQNYLDCLEKRVTNLECIICNMRLGFQTALGEFEQIIGYTKEEIAAMTSDEYSELILGPLGFRSMKNNKNRVEKVFEEKVLEETI